MRSVPKLSDGARDRDPHHNSASHLHSRTTDALALAVIHAVTHRDENRDSNPEPDANSKHNRVADFQRNRQADAERDTHAVWPNFI
jgi:hypothetical protein